MRCNMCRDTIPIGKWYAHHINANRAHCLVCWWRFAYSKNVSDKIIFLSSKLKIRQIEEPPAR